jgi:hypothetical protein
MNHDLSHLPERLSTMLEDALVRIADSGEREAVGQAARSIAAVAWTRWLSERPRSDNRPEHEFIVFDNMLRIAESEALPLFEKRIATAFCFLHDTCFIPRIMEGDVLRLRESGAMREADELDARRIDQRTAHMRGSARNAEDALNGLLKPDEIDRCVALVAKHDCWKLGEPWPCGDDQLAVVCFESDALWPLHPLGVLAALELSSANGNFRDSGNPAVWQAQARESLDTLVHFRRNWEGLPDEGFRDDASLFRTREGHRLSLVWKEFWFGNR